MRAISGGDSSLRQRGPTSAMRHCVIGLSLAAAAAAGLGSDAAEAQTSSITQITRSAGFFGSFFPAISASGTRIAFVADVDLTPRRPGNADRSREIFLFDTTAGDLMQITDTANGFGYNDNPSMNADGTRIAFVSTHDLVPGSPGNADGNQEIFVFDTATRSFTQITDSIGFGGIWGPVMNADGSRIAFVSNLDLTPGSPGNADANAEIFLFDAATGQLAQITDSTGRFGSGSSDPSISADGTRIAFTSDRDLAPGNPGNADGNKEVFLFDTGTGALIQLTNSTNPNSIPRPKIDAAGLRVTFGAAYDLAPGNPGNADGNDEIFLLDIATGLVTQITNSTACFNGWSGISGSGTRISFISTCDLTPGNPGNADGNQELFLFDSAGGIRQLTQSRAGGLLGGLVGGHAINGDGTRIAFDSDLNLKPSQAGNGDRNMEIFLANVPLEADLKLKKISDPPLAAKRWSTFTVTDSVRNRGAGASRAAQVRYYLSADTQLDAGDVRLLGKRALPALEPGALSTGSASVRVPGDANYGTYFLVACADDPNIVKENNESNNCRVSATRVTVGP